MPLTVSKVNSVVSSRLEHELELGVEVACNVVNGHPVRYTPCLKAGEH